MINKLIKLLIKQHRALVDKEESLYRVMPARNTKKTSKFMYKHHT